MLNRRQFLVVLPAVAGVAALWPASLSCPTTSTTCQYTRGDRAVDREGNTYRFVDFMRSVYDGCFVQIDSTYLAWPLSGTASSSLVGVVIGGDASIIFGRSPLPDRSGWVLVSGRLHDHSAGT